MAHAPRPVARREVIIEYLSAQAVNGCQVLQVFEAMGEHISPANLETFAVPAMARIASALKERHPEAAGEDHPSE
eukprot:Skav230320  [mRNA]  locus=scaffold430:409764:410998:+ [translate_table: standard]